MRKLRAVLAVGALAVAMLTPANEASAVLAACQTDRPIQGDIDGDAVADLVVGVPGGVSGAGKVDLRLSTAPSTVLTKDAAGLGNGAAGDRFGAAVALADLNEDGCSDLLVGAPGAVGGAGRVYVIFGANDGFQPTGALTLDGGAAAGDGFGSSLAVASHISRVGFDIWVGAPNDDIGAATDAGSVAHYSAVLSGGNLAVAKVETVSQDTAKVPGVAETNDRFGSVLSASRQGALVGDPDEDIGNARDAGSITVLGSRDDGGRGFDVAYSRSQESAGVSGEPETGDRFGAAVNAFLGVSVVGVPGEDLGSLADAGMVHTFASASIDEPAPQPRAAITQDSSRIPGVAEAGDRFGAAVVIARNVCFNDALQAAVGAPGEDVTVGGSSKADAGTVDVFTVSLGDTCYLAVDQNTVLSGVPEAGDHLGATLALGRHSDDDDDAADRAFIGVPQEDREDVLNAGIVQSTAIGSGADSTSILVAGSFRTSVGYSGGAVTNMSYGTVIASPASVD